MIEPKDKIVILSTHMTENDITVINNAIDEARKEGRKEVLKWLRSHDAKIYFDEPDERYREKYERDWQAQLKKWGLL